MLPPIASLQISLLKGNLKGFVNRRTSKMSRTGWFWWTLPPLVVVIGEESINETKGSNYGSKQEHLCVESQPCKINPNLLSIIFPIKEKGFRVFWDWMDTPDASWLLTWRGQGAAPWRSRRTWPSVCRDCIFRFHSWGPVIVSSIWTARTQETRFTTPYMALEWKFILLLQSAEQDVFAGQVMADSKIQKRFSRWRSHRAEGRQRCRCRCSVTV